jgi:Na+/proline symporter
MSLPLIGLLVYVLLQLGIGIVVSRRIRTEDDYLVAGRRLGVPMVACSIFATWFGAETCISAAGTIYQDGVGATSVEPFAYGICLLLTGLLFAAPMWRRRITTLADLLRQRYSRGVERFASVVLIPTSVLWAAAQVRAFGHVLSSAAGLEVETAIALAAGFTMLYTVFGGMLADVITDLVQGGALVIGLVVMLFVVVGDVGGFGAAVARIDPARIFPASAAAGGWLDLAEIWAIPLCGSVLAQEVLSRSLAARSATVARTGVLLGGGAYVLVGLIPVFLGLLGATLLPELEAGEQVLPELARRHLSTLGYVLFAGALVSAILSTVDSALLVASSFLSRNLLLSGDRNVSEPTRVLVARGGVLCFGVLAWVLAHTFDSVPELVEEASAFGSAGVLVVVGFGLFSRIGGATSALLSLVGGISAWVLGAHLVGWPHPYLGSLAAALAGFLLPVALSAARRLH